MSIDKVWNRYTPTWMVDWEQAKDTFAGFALTGILIGEIFNHPTIFIIGVIGMVLYLMSRWKVNLE